MAWGYPLLDFFWLLSISLSFYTKTSSVFFPVPEAVIMLTEIHLGDIPQIMEPWVRSC